MHDESKFVLEESGKLLIEPYMEELPILFVSYFKAILRVGYAIPRLECYMSHGKSWRATRLLINPISNIQIEAEKIYKNEIPFNISPHFSHFLSKFRLVVHSVSDKHQFGHLHTIDENHIDMLKLFESIRQIVVANQTGPTIYLYPIYSYYSSLLSDQIRAMTEQVFQQTIIPNLPVNFDFWFSIRLQCSCSCSIQWTSVIPTVVRRWLRQTLDVSVKHIHFSFFNFLFSLRFSPTDIYFANGKIAKCHRRKFLSGWFCAIEFIHAGLPKTEQSDCQFDSWN